MIPYRKDNKILASNLRNNMTKYEKGYGMIVLDFFQLSLLDRKD